MLLLKLLFVVSCASAFGPNNRGYSLIDLPGNGGADIAEGLVVLQDGTIVVCGSATPSMNLDWALVGLQPDGVEKWRTITDHMGGPDVMRDCALDPLSDSIYAVGFVTEEGAKEGFVMRFTADGTRDNAFNYMIARPGSSENLEWKAVAVQPGGNAIAVVGVDQDSWVVGTFDATGTRVALKRLNILGEARDVIFDQSLVVVGGFDRSPAAPFSSFVVARMDLMLNNDPAWNAGDYLKYGFGVGQDDQGYSIAKGVGVPEAYYVFGGSDNDATGAVDRVFGAAWFDNAGNPLGAVVISSNPVTDLPYAGLVTPAGAVVVAGTGGTPIGGLLMQYNEKLDGVTWSRALTLGTDTRYTSVAYNPTRQTIVAAGYVQQAPGNYLVSSYELNGDTDLGPVAASTTIAVTTTTIVATPRGGTTPPGTTLGATTLAPTTTSSPTSSPTPCPLFGTPGVTCVNGVSIVMGTITLSNGTALNDVSLVDGGTVIVMGETSVSGNLDLVLDSVPGNPIEVISYGSISGQFSNINVTIPTLECGKAVAEPTYGASSLSLAISVDDDGCSDGGLGPGAIGGIIAGVLVCIFLLVGVPLIVSCVRAKQVEGKSMARLAVASNKAHMGSVVSPRD